MQNISIIGSTGSIGTQALNVIRKNRDKFRLISLSAHTNMKLLKQQIEEFKPQFCVVTDESQKDKIAAEDFPQTEIVFGKEYLNEAVAIPQVDTVLVAVVGLSALPATVEAIKSKKRVALANKEVIVAAGEIIIGLAKKYGCEIIPVDSEHSAIFQCLMGQDRKNLKRIILTASGGPFREFTGSQLENVTVEMALKHPSWKMGKKITVDSSTLMNKGFEVIEARWFFDVAAENIDCIIHPQSVIHSMVEFKDNSVLAQMSRPSMEIPIQLAFSYPERFESGVPQLDLGALKKLEFFEIDRKKFPCLDMAYFALKEGGILPAVLNSANEAAVEMFLNNRIKFTDIPRLIEKALSHFGGRIKPTLESVYCIDKEVRSFIYGKFDAVQI